MSLDEFVDIGSFDLRIFCRVSCGSRDRLECGSQFISVDRGSLAYVELVDIADMSAKLTLFTDARMLVRLSMGFSLS